MCPAPGDTASMSRFDIDKLERCYRRVYPTKIFLENARQVVTASAAGLIVAAIAFFLQHAISQQNSAAPREVSVFLVTAFASILVVGYVSLWSATVRNFWKLGALLTLTITLLIGQSILETGAETAAPIVNVITTLTTRAPLYAAMLLTLVGLVLACYGHFIWVLLQASYALTLVGASDRKIIRDLPSRQAATGFFSRFWSFPPLFKFARRPTPRYAAIILLSLVCAVFFSIVTILPVVLTMPLEEIGRVNEKCGTDIDCILARVPQLLVSFAFPFATVLVCFIVGWIGQLWLRRLLRFSLEALQEADTRPPVLFLRAFRDDQVPLRSPNVALFGRLLELGRRADTLDQLLLEEGTPCGPVVGLGSPTDKRPPYGAARGYFAAENWQDAVADLVTKSTFTVICLDDTAGIWWEVSHLAGERHLGKTLFLIHPRFASKTKNAGMLTRVSQHFGEGPIGEALQQKSPQAERGRKTQTVIGFFCDREAGLCILQSSTFSRFAYLLALRVFVRRQLGLVTIR